jgi:hypothetical protein
MTKLLLNIAATVAAECAYVMLGALLPTLTILQALALATGLHLLAHWLIAGHMTWATATEVAVTVLGVDLVTHHVPHLHGNLPRAALHLAVVLGVALYHRRRR